MTQPNDHPGGQPQQGPAAPQPTPPGHNKAIASLVIGIIAVLSILTGVGAIAGVILGVVGLVLGISSKNEATSSMATAGIVLNLVATGIAAVVFVSCVACVGCSMLPALAG